MVPGGEGDGGGEGGGGEVGGSGGESGGEGGEGDGDGGSGGGGAGGGGDGGDEMVYEPQISKPLPMTDAFAYHVNVSPRSSGRWRSRWCRCNVVPI